MFKELNGLKDIMHKSLTTTVKMYKHLYTGEKSTKSWADLSNSCKEKINHI